MSIPLTESGLFKMLDMSNEPDIDFLTDISDTQYISIQGDTHDIEYSFDKHVTPITLNVPQLPATGRTPIHSWNSPDFNDTSDQNGINGVDTAFVFIVNQRMSAIGMIIIKTRHAFRWALRAVMDSASVARL